MLRRIFALCVVALWAGALFGQSVEATPENAAPFLGEWSLSTGEGLSVVINIKVVEGKLVGEISGAPLPTGKASALAKYDKGLALQYGMDYNGSPVDVTISLEPDGAKMWGYLSFAGGAYKTSGEAVKKKKE